MMRFFGKEGMNKQKLSFEAQIEGLQRTVREGSAPKVIEHLSSLIEKNSGGKRSPYVLLRRAAAEIALSSFGEEESKSNAALDAADAMYELATHLRELAESVPKRAINKKAALSGLKMLTRVYGTPREASGASVAEATPEEARAFKNVRMDIYRFMRKGENMIVLSLVLKALKEFPRETHNFKQFLGSVADDISIRYWGLPTEDITTEEEWIEDLRGSSRQTAADSMVPSAISSGIPRATRTARPRRGRVRGRSGGAMRSGRPRRPSTYALVNVGPSEMPSVRNVSVGPSSSKTSLSYTSNAAAVTGARSTSSVRRAGNPAAAALRTSSAPPLHTSDRSAMYSRRWSCGPPGASGDSIPGMAMRFSLSAALRVSRDLRCGIWIAID
jgi:hypothetical protein